MVESNGDDDGVKSGMVVKDVEVFGSVGGRRRGMVVVDSEVNIEDFVSVMNEVFRQRKVEVDVEDGKYEVERKLKVND